MEDRIKSNNHAHTINAQGSSHIQIGDNITFNNGPSAEKSTILRELSQGRSYVEMMNTKDDRVPGTCEWVLAHHAYKRWREGDAPVLWISGRAGCGKSVLAKYLIEDVLSSTQQTVCYFFFHFGLERDARRAIRCILHQLLQARDDLFSDDVCRRFGGTAPLLDSLDELWYMLVVVAESSSNDIICVLDAYDECSLEHREIFNARLRSFLQTKGQRRLKLLVTSRGEVDIRESLTHPYVAHLDCENGPEGECIHRDILLWLEHQIGARASDLHLDAEGKAILRDTIVKGQDRTYIWAHLMMKWIDQEKRSLHGLDTKRLQDALRKMPPGTQDAYQGILNRVQSHDRRTIRLLMHLVVAAHRPLTLSEVNIALCIRSRMTSMKELDLIPEKRLERWIREKSACFVSVISSKVYLFHQTAQEFLVTPAREINAPRWTRDRNFPTARPAWLHPHVALWSDNAMWTAAFEKRADALLDDTHNDNDNNNSNSNFDVSDTAAWQHSIHPMVSRMIIARVVVWYVLLAEGQDWTLEDHDTQPLAAFFDYCITHWSVHRITGRYNNLKHLLALCTPTANRAPSWFTARNSDRRSPSASSFYIAAVSRVTPVAQEILGQLAAAARGSDEEKDLLRNISWTDGLGRNGFHDAVQFHNQELVEMCIEKGRGLPPSFWDSPDSLGYTPLAYAAVEGYRDTVESLLRKHCSTSANNKKAISPWVCAIWSNDPTIAQKFPQFKLERQLTLERKLEITQHELTLLVVSGEREVLPNLMRMAGMNPVLDLDVCLGEIESLLISRFNPYFKAPLVEYPVSPPWSEARRFNGLELLAMFGNEYVIQLCIDSGVDVSSVSHDGFTLLHLAASVGHCPAISLLSRYIDIQKLTPDGRTALQLSPDPQSVRVLLRQGARFEGFPYLTKAQNDTILELLRGTGPLKQRFMSFTQYVVFRVLLEKDMDILKSFYRHAPRAEVDSGWVLPFDKGERSARQPTGHLIHAMIQLAPIVDEDFIGYIVCMLLEAGADVNAKDELGRRVRDSHYMNRFKKQETRALVEAVMREYGGIKGDEEGRPRFDRIEGAGAAVATHKLSCDVAAAVFALR